MHRKILTAKEAIEILQSVPEDTPLFTYGGDHEHFPIRMSDHFVEYFPEWGAWFEYHEGSESENCEKVRAILIHNG